MKNLFLKSAVVAVAAVGLTAGGALALPTLTLTDESGRTVVIEDGGVGDLSPGQGSVAFFISGFSGTNTAYGEGTSFPHMGSVGFPAMHLTASVSAGRQGAGSITFRFEDTFTAWDANMPGLLSEFATQGMRAGYSTYMDGILWSSFGPVDGLFAESQSSSISPFDPNNYTIAMVGTLTYVAGQTGSIDAGVEPIPEPATMLLFGAGLAGLAGVAKRRKAKAAAKE